MKLLAWLCIAWRPPVSSTFTHISFNDHPRRSPKSSAPNSANQGVMTAAASTRSGLSPGLSIAVWARFADELFAWSARSLKCPIKPPTSPGSSAPGTRMKGVGKSPMTSGIAYLLDRRRLLRTSHRNGSVYKGRGDKLVTCVSGSRDLILAEASLLPMHARLVRGEQKIGSIATLICGKSDGSLILH